MAVALDSSVGVAVGAGVGGASVGTRVGGTAVGSTRGVFVGVGVAWAEGAQLVIVPETTDKTRITRIIDLRKCLVTNSS